MSILGVLFGQPQLCSCCKQQSRELLAVANVLPRGGMLAVSLCLQCRHGHWRRTGLRHGELSVYQQTESCPLNP